MFSVLIVKISFGNIQGVGNKSLADFGQFGPDLTAYLSFFLTWRLRETALQLSLLIAGFLFLVWHNPAS